MQPADVAVAALPQPIAFLYQLTVFDFVQQLNVFVVYHIAFVLRSSSICLCHE